MIILLSGPVAAGKDTIADYIVKNQKHFIKLSLADKLKEEASKRYGLDMQYFYDRDLKDTILKSHGCTPRNLLIEYARIKKAQEVNYFVNKVIAQMTQADCSYIIPDCRFMHEVEAFKQGFECPVQLIWVKRQVPLIADSTEISEQDCDYSIDNNQSPFDGCKIIVQMK